MFCYGVIVIGLSDYRFKIMRIGDILNFLILSGFIRFFVVVVNNGEKFKRWYCGL